MTWYSSHQWKETLGTVCFLDKWPRTKSKVTFDTSFWYRFLCSFTWCPSICSPWQFLVLLHVECSLRISPSALIAASCFENFYPCFVRKKPREFATNLIASQVIGIKTWSPGKWRDRIFVQSGQVQTISRVRFAKVSSFDLKVSDDQASKGKLIWK